MHTENINGKALQAQVKKKSMGIIDIIMAPSAFGASLGLAARKKLIQAIKDSNRAKSNTTSGKTLLLFIF
jgi:hypothetical protein